MLRRSFLQFGLAGLAMPALAARAAETGSSTPGMRFNVSYVATPGIKGVHGVTDAGDGALWLCGERNGTLGRFDTRTGEVKALGLGEGSAPRSVVRGPDGAAWITDAGRNAILRVDPAGGKVEPFGLPPERPRADLDSLAFDGDGQLWFTGGEGVLGRLDPKTGKIGLKDAPRGRGVAGIAVTPSGEIWYASVAGGYIARINPQTFEIVPAAVSKPDLGPRRLWADSKDRIWVSEANSGHVAALETTSQTWKRWKLPGDRPRPYAIYVDDADQVWLSDTATNSVVHFDPVTEAFTSLSSDRPRAEVRQMAGRSGEVWAAESGTDRLMRIQTVKQA